ncbi:MAG: PASTA domain-containing protein, partial [Actinomycetota bacterium]|nr:PASTA domain-containing protein [Actinomycetota bacterium]
SVTVSAGLPPVTIPNLTTFSSCKDAIAALAAIHLVGVCPSSVAQYSSTVPAGAILGSSPTQSALYGSTVTIITSKGHAPVTVPAVAGVGTTYAGAVTALQGAGFQVKRIDEYSSTVAAGAVIGTTPDPSAGPQPYGSTVTVAVSLGPKPVPVPDVTDDSIGQAESALQAAGLVVGGAYGPPKAKVVIGTDPAAGTVVLPGTTVYLYVG